MVCNETVCVVLVTFNRKELLIECLDALENQSRKVNAIYLIDNASTDETPELLLKHCYIGELPPNTLGKPWEKTFVKNEIFIHYVRMHENTGGAGGFHEGVKRAYEKGYEWLWITDDDVEANEHCLKHLLNKKSLSHVLVPLRISDNNEIEEYTTIKYNWSNPLKIDPKELLFKDKFKKIDEIPETVLIQDFSFEGPLINRQIINKIGYPRKDFFSQGDDTDYSLKISCILNENIILVKNALMIRKLKNNTLTGWKMYYFVRNMNYLHLRYGSNIFVRVKPFFVSIIAIIYNLIKLNPEKILIWYYAIIDSLKKDFPKRYKP